MSDPRVMMYTTPFCGFCHAAKRLLQRDDVAFSEVDLSGDWQRRQTLIAETGWRTVPIILIDDTLIGGYTELADLRARGGFVELGLLGGETPA